MKCKLCQLDRPLQQSHIIPEFCYKPLYDLKHRYNVLSTEQNEKAKILQKGLREQLLCKVCEEKFSKYETYASKLFCGGTKLNVRRTHDRDVVTNVNYSYFKLYQLSILWRMSVSGLPMFVNVNLGPHEEKLRAMLLNELPGKYYHYGCICMFSYLDNKLMKSLILQPDVVKIDGVPIIRAIHSGVLWLYHISSHNNMLRYKHLFLSERGELNLLNQDLAEVELFTKLLSKLAQKKNKKAEP